MSEQETSALLRDIVIKKSRLPVEEFSDDGSLVEEAGLDSLALMMALAEVEERFSIRFPIERVGSLKDLSFSQFVKLVNEERERSSVAQSDANIPLR